MVIQPQVAASLKPCGLRRDVCALPHQVDAHDHASVISFTRAARNSALLGGIPEGIRGNMERFPISLHNHGFGLQLEV